MRLDGMGWDGMGWYLGRGEEYKKGIRFKSRCSCNHLHHILCANLINV